MDVYSALIQALRERFPGMELREREPMERHTSFRIGGPARLMALPRSEEEAAGVVQAARAHGIEPFFMGNGSNLLVSDTGYEGLILKTFDGMDHLSVEGEVIRAGSGVLLSRLANFALEHGLTGLEFAHGIPGTVGGALMMNAGAYGGEMCQVAQETRVLTPEGTICAVVGEEQGFSYRHSAFSDGTRLILGGVFRLEWGERGDIRAKMEDLAARRREKQPLEYPSAGSTFKRPEGHFAAALIERCGLKGKRVGGAQVSEKHAGFVINRGGATCADVMDLTAHIRETVFRETGVTLEMEVRTLGI
ncbi:UDP-N-acetylmuramate dehydrogenase [Pseudoflavonifractor sp. MCC625]|uniref:UDP-N-acetylmuramate dehydrogenase n=1 Tax=Pseudoflavonifractor sp. MCC625 TaxID=2592647 RepID=UPI001C00C837|nr:UDP-N-acetylmuramate dehydrogenase [Pseudoflavonifractor sp. MCC625]